jgi:hypothetical protein
MIQNLADTYVFLRHALRWFVIWVVVSLLIVGSIASYSWGKIAINGYDWSFKIIKE